MNPKKFYLDQVAIRLVKEPPLLSVYPIRTPQDVIRLMTDVLQDYDREIFAVVNLQNDLKPININLVSMGVLNQSLVHPREMMKSVILSNAAAIMLVHNHPSGDLSPSKDDIALTDRIAQICELFGIRLLEHMIIGRGEEYYSFHEKEILPVPKIQYSESIRDIELGGNKVAENSTQEYPQKQVTLIVTECGEFQNMGEFHEDIENAKEALEIFHAIPSERMNAVPSIGIRLYRGDRSGEFIEVDLMNAKYMDLESLEHVPEIRNHKEAQKLIADLIYLKPDLEIRGEIPESIQKRVQMLEAKEKQEVQMKAITEKLEQGVKDVFQSDQYQNFLNTMAKFPRYSVNNSLLIMMQKPEAKLCQSFTGWKEMGRFVKKGEKGIKILAPAPYTIHREQNKLDENGNKIIDLDGKPIMENVEVKINAFKVVNTFDVSQTEGKELSNIGVEELMGSVKDYTDMFEAIKESIPVPITFEQIESGAKGYFQRSENRIALQEGMSEIQTIKTLLHEAAHQKLHSMENSKKGEMPKTRLQKEVEAESVAYVVCQHYGIDTSDYSFGYVAGWSGGKELPELKAALQTIRRAASELISSIDEKWKGLVTAKETERKPEEQSRKSVAKKPSVKKTISEKKEKAARTPKEKKEKINGELAPVL